MENLTYCLAKSQKEKKEALFLVEKEYIKQDYIDPKNSDCKLEISKFSATFVAKLNGKVAGTVSIVFDSESGLPMDDIYKDELEKFRNSNKKIVEVCRLATDNDFLKNSGVFDKKRNSLSLLISLFKLVFHYSIYKNIDYICISINPKHDLFYKSLGFEDIGGLKYYPSVNNAPALAKAIRIDELKTKNKKSLIGNLLWKNPPEYKMFK